MVLGIQRTRVSADGLRADARNRNPYTVLGIELTRVSAYGLRADARNRNPEPPKELDTQLTRVSAY